jgi:cyclase
VISAGDVYSPASFPVVEAKRGGTMQGTLGALNLMLDFTVPEYNQQGGTRVIPGHGHLSNEADVDDYRNWMTIVRDRIKAMVEQGMTAAQIAAARPTLDFDALYDGNKAWTGPQLVETIQAELRDSLSSSNKATR